MSPEVLEGATEFSAFAFRQIDVYAAALVLWEVIKRTVFHDRKISFFLSYRNRSSQQIFFLYRRSRRTV